VTLSAQVLGATQAPETARAVMHTVITAHLVLVSICIAAFVAHRSVRHSRLVMDGWLIAAVLAATAAICGYFDLVPGAEAIFTRHERGTGTFKDPNVFGPFLIAPTLYVLHLALTRRVATAVPALLGGLLMSAGLLLSFSRGAWLCLAVSVVVWGAITYVHGSRGERRKLVSVCICGILTATVLLAFALQLDEVSRLMEMRASLSQSYDHGPDGRFGGQLKALALVAEHPLGIGSLTFSPLYHHEEAHNVYLSMFMNAGWIGGGLYLVTVLLTIVLGFARLTASGEARPYLTIALATFLAIALEGAIIDSDHWRHFYVLMGLVWGLSTASAKTQVREH
jgi:O-antigen ligase